MAVASEEEGEVGGRGGVVLLEKCCRHFRSEECETWCAVGEEREEEA